MIKKIYQLADIHIPTYQKLDIYAEQLEKIINSISEDVAKSNLQPDEVRIVICGDLVHSKNIVTNELNVFVSLFLRQLSSIAKVICFAGNHDLIASNTSRTDTLSAIFQTAQFDNALFLDMMLNYESGIIYDNNITWALYSIFDDFKAPDITSSKEETPNNMVIGLYHGTVVGSKLYNGIINDSGSTSELFEGCDYVMAGHIHKRQELKHGDCTIVYAGSVIQQNYGESITQHGYVIWDIENNTHDFVDIPLEHNYIDVSINNIDDILNDKETLNNY